MRYPSWLIGKRVADFLLVLVELFLLGRTAEALRAKIDRKSAISLQRGHFDLKFQVEGVAPPFIFARIVRPVFTHRNFIADFLQAKCDFGGISAVLRF